MEQRKSSEELDLPRGCSAETDIVRAVYEGLTEVDPKTLHEIPGVAEKWTASGDYRTWTFQLRNNAKWSNGDAVKAEDFVRSWKRLDEMGGASHIETCSKTFSECIQSRKLRLLRLPCRPMLRKVRHRRLLPVCLLPPRVRTADRLRSGLPNHRRRQGTKAAGMKSAKALLMSKNLESKRRNTESPASWP